MKVDPTDAWKELARGQNGAPGWLRKVVALSLGVVTLCVLSTKA